MPPEMVRRVFESASSEVVLIGGQSLAFWMDWYGVDLDAGIHPAVSRDVDFFVRNASNASPLRDFARAIGGQAFVRNEHAISALVGSAFAPSGDGRIYNVDLLHAVVGLTRDRIIGNAVSVSADDGRFPLMVLHPLDLLVSRCSNLHLLIDKQDNVGRLQLSLAISVARHFLVSVVEEISGRNLPRDRCRREILNFIRSVSRYSRGDAATKNAARYGLFVADAIPAWEVECDNFWEKQWPHLKKRMSASHREICESRRGV